MKDEGTLLSGANNERAEDVAHTLVRKHTRKTLCRSEDHVSTVANSQQRRRGATGARRSTKRTDHNERDHTMPVTTEDARRRSETAPPIAGSAETSRDLTIHGQQTTSSQAIRSPHSRLPTDRATRDEGTVPRPADRISTPTRPRGYSIFPCRRRTETPTPCLRTSPRNNYISLSEGR